MIRALLVLLAFARLAWADASAGAEAAADRAFQAAMQRAVAGDASAINAFEALGAERPVTRWTDDAWAEAARLAERTRDYARARRDYEQIVALDAGGLRPDPKQLARAKSALARLASDTGDGRWDSVTHEHERLVSVVFGGGDPRDALAQLEAIVTRDPDYPRVNAIRLALGRGWEEEGEQTRALRWWHAAADAEPAARVALIRALIRASHLDDAERELERAEAMAAKQPPVSSSNESGAIIDRTALAFARQALATAKRRAWIARGLWAVLVLAAVGALLVLRRAEGSWRAVGKRVVVPPTEVVFLIPIAGVLVAVASTGNPLAARAVRWIAIAGVVIAWVSGVVLDAARAHGPLRAPRIAAQVMVVVAVVGAAGYLAVLRSGSLDLILETWRGGHALR